MSSVRYGFQSFFFSKWFTTCSWFTGNTNLGQLLTWKAFKHYSTPSWNIRKEIQVWPSLLSERYFHFLEEEAINERRWWLIREKILWLGSGLQPCDWDCGCYSFRISETETTWTQVMRRLNMTVADLLATSLQLSNQSDLLRPCSATFSDVREIDAREEKVSKQGFCLYPWSPLCEEIRKRKSADSSEVPPCLKKCNQQLKNSIIQSYANHNAIKWLLLCNRITSCSRKPFPSPPARHKFTARPVTKLATQALCWQSGRQAGMHPLPSATAFLWSHLLCNIAVLFTRNCYQRRGQKNDHMPWAADLRFLYLHVSQNTALYRNAEGRPQQTSSRTEALSSDWT